MSSTWRSQLITGFQLSHVRSTNLNNISSNSPAIPCPWAHRRRLPCLIVSNCWLPSDLFMFDKGGWCAQTLAIRATDVAPATPVSRDPRHAVSTAPRSSGSSRAMVETCALDVSSTVDPAWAGTRQFCGATVFEAYGNSPDWSRHPTKSLNLPQPPVQMVPTRENAAHPTSPS